MYKIKNILENKMIFSGNDIELIEFVKKISKENDDENMSFIGVSDAIEYIQEYCDNLEIIY